MDVVVVPFPFVDSPKAKPRPALVISKKRFNHDNEHVVLMMITTGGVTKWESDIPISQIAPTGLTIPSIVRPKIFTLDARIIRKKIGKLSTKDSGNVRKLLNNVLG